MNHIPTVLLLLWSSGLQAEENDSPEPGNIRLMGGATRCAGGLEMKLHNDWKPVDDPLFGWNLRTADVVCRQLDCGSVVSAKLKESYIARHVWKINAYNVQSGSALTATASMKPKYSLTSLEITCSDSGGRSSQILCLRKSNITMKKVLILPQNGSWWYDNRYYCIFYQQESVRLVNGTTLCSGRVEVKANQSWSSVCEGDFDWQNAEVVCRELGCGAPSDLVLCENTKALKWTTKFQCRGNESTLRDCESYESARTTCSPIGVACSEPDNVQLVEGSSRCTGRLEMKLQGDWKPVDSAKGDLTSAALVCTQLKCGSAVSTELKPSAAKSVWGIISSRVQAGSALRECVSTRPWNSRSSLEITCSDVLYQPTISVSPSIGRVDEFSIFTISCSIKPQYPGGSFQLTLTTAYTTQNYTQRAVNHIALFRFPSANRGHQGNYSCVYEIDVFSHKLSSASRPLSLNISDSPVVYIPRFTVLLLTLALFVFAICFHKKATRGQQPGGQEKLHHYDLGASRAEGLLNEEAAAQRRDL